MGISSDSEAGKVPHSRKVWCWCSLSLVALVVITVSSGCDSAPSPSPEPPEGPTTGPPSTNTTPIPATPTPSPPKASYSCKSDLQLGPVVAVDKKGICLDDTTFSTCAGNIPLLYPNTNDRVTSLRLFAPWKNEWPEAAREEAWNNLQAYVETNDAKILLGAEITCDTTNDAQVWNWTKQLISKLGSNRFMGLAIGNEMDLLWMKGPKFQTPACIARLWDSTSPSSFVQTFLSRIEELDNMIPGFKNVPVTTVWSTYCYAQEPFMDNPTQVMCKSFFEQAIKKFGTRFTFSFNIYPYFDSGNHIDAGTTDQCQDSLKGKLCFDDASCFTNAVATVGRTKIRSLLQSMNLNHEKYQLWIGESGWSSPVSSTTQPNMKNCPEWSSQDTFVKNYNGWLKWDLTLTQDPSIAPADHVFFFTMRDSLNFGETEHFGLISKCNDTKCKLQKLAQSPKVIHRSPKALSNVVIA